MFKFSLKGITITLLIVVIALLLINIVINKLIITDEQVKNREEISGIMIDSLFRSALHNYGIKNDWIKKKKIRKLSGDSLFATYSIIVPKDVPIHLLQLEAKNLLWDYDTEIISEERTKEKKVLLQISSGKQLKLAAEFSYNDEIRREYGTVSFLVNEINSSDIEKYNELLRTPELYFAVLLPENNSKPIVKDLEENERRFAIILNDNITEFDYKLSPSISEERTLLSLKNIVSSFYSAAFFIIDVNSDLYESKNFMLIKEALQKRKIKIIESEKFDLLSNVSINPESSLSGLMKNLGKNDEKVVMTTADDYLLISRLFPDYRKIGYRIIQPGELVLRM